MHKDSFVAGIMAIPKRNSRVVVVVGERVEQKSSIGSTDVYNGKEAGF